MGAQINAVTNTIETLVTGTIMNSLANGAWADGNTTIDNTATYGGQQNYLEEDGILVFGTAVTCGASAPNVAIEFTYLIDGTHSSPSDANAQPSDVYTFPLVPGGTYSAIDCRNIPLLPYKFVAHIQNNTGATWPASSNTFQGVRRTIANY